MKKFKLLFIAVALITSYSLTAQVAVTTDGSSADASAMLEVKSTDKGFLPPRMTAAEMIAIPTPAEGLIVYCADCTPKAPQFFNGTSWTNMIDGSTITVPDAPTIGTATPGDAQASVPFTAPTDGGSIITFYTATSDPGGFTGTLTQAGSGTITVTGLTNGTAYTFTVTATNAMGMGAASAASNSVTPSLPPTIGDSYQGGIIAYILQSGDPGYVEGVTHGLIAAASDQSTGTIWGCYETPISGADGTALGTGNQNTIDIEAGCETAGTPADICANLSLNGYDDWYLPSKDELNKLYAMKVLGFGGFASAAYWSSSEYSNFHAWGQSFVNGYKGTYSKEYPGRVRAVRAF